MYSLKALSAHAHYHHNLYEKRYRGDLLFCQFSIAVRKQSVYFDLLTTRGVFSICHNLQANLSTCQKAGRSGFTSRFLNGNFPGEVAPERLTPLYLNLHQPRWLRSYIAYLKAPGKCECRAPRVNLAKPQAKPKRRPRSRNANSSVTTVTGPKPAPVVTDLHADRYYSTVRSVRF